jgi:hypothetical protein
MKIRPVGAKLFHAHGRTDMTKLLAISQPRLKIIKRLSSLSLQNACLIVTSCVLKMKIENYTKNAVCSESRCALRLRYVGLGVSVAVAHARLMS